MYYHVTLFLPKENGFMAKALHVCPPRHLYNLCYPLNYLFTVICKLTSARQMFTFHSKETRKTKHIFYGRWVLHLNRTFQKVHKDFFFLFCHIKSSRLTITTNRYSAEVLAEMMLCMFKKGKLTGDTVVFDPINKKKNKTIQVC